MNSEIATTSNNPLSVANFILKPDGLEAVGDPSLEDWQKVGEFIKKSSESVHFWIGDWLNYGEMHWGETYKKTIEAFGFDYSTLRNDKWVSSKIPQDRRRSDLSFAHHEVVASLEEEDQEELLEEAVRKNLSRNDFRKVVKAWETAGTSAPQENLSRQRDKTVSDDQNELVAQDITFNIELMLTNIDKCNFETLSSSTRNELIKKLHTGRNRIDGILMTYEEDE